MRTIERTGQFKRDFKRESKGQHRLTLQADLTAVVMALANDQILDSRHRDHGLRVRKNEPLESCLQRVAVSELGLQASDVQAAKP
jgi:mRNA-degrading endonuclease YafQ of YafQ-DinJ toxin-antitoxin module